MPKNPPTRRDYTPVPRITQLIMNPTSPLGETPTKPSPLEYFATLLGEDNIPKLLPSQEQTIILASQPQFTTGLPEDISLDVPMTLIHKKSETEYLVKGDASGREVFLTIDPRDILAIQINPTPKEVED